MIGRRKWEGDVQWFIDNESVVHSGNTVQEVSWNKVIEWEDSDVWGMVKKVGEVFMRSGRKLDVTWVKAHVEKRKNSKRRWTVEELGNWRVDRRQGREIVH